MFNSMLLNPAMQAGANAAIIGNPALAGIGLLSPTTKQTAVEPQQFFQTADGRHVQTPPWERADQVFTQEVRPPLAKDISTPKMIPGAGVLTPSTLAARGIGTVAYNAQDNPELEQALQVFLTHPDVVRFQDIVTNLDRLSPAEIQQQMSSLSLDRIVQASVPYLSRVTAYVGSFVNEGSMAVQALVRSAEELLGKTTSTLSQMSPKHVAMAATMLLAAAFIPGAFASDGTEETSALLSALQTIGQVGGGLAFFFLGMKFMPEGLRDAFGNQLRKVMAKLAGNRFSGYATGAAVTATWQSSSITTSVNVGLVSQNIITRFQALAINLGANLGTCMTGLFFALPVSKWGPYFAAIGLPYFFFDEGTKYQKTKSLAKAIFGFGSLFTGLEMMKHALKTPEMIARFEYAMTALHEHGLMNGTTLIGVLSCILLATAATATIQSSSATLGIVLALAGATSAATGDPVFGFHTAAACVFGLNIGTTVTALMAAAQKGATRDALRSAVGHTFFNTALVLALFAFSPQYIDLLHKILSNPAFEGMYKRFDMNPLEGQIVFSHWTFNLVEGLVFLPFLRHVNNLLMKLVPDKQVAEDLFTHLPGELIKIPDLAVEAAQKEISGMADDVTNMFALLDDVMVAFRRNQADAVMKLEGVQPEIEALENIVDHKQAEIQPFLDLIPTTHRTHHLNEATDQIENLGDLVTGLVEQLKGLESWKHKIDDDELRSDAFELYRLVSDYSCFVLAELQSAYTENGTDIKDPHAFFARAIALDTEIKDAITAFRAKYHHEKKGVLGKIPGKARPFFSSLTDPEVGTLTTMRGVVQNIAEALAGKK
ncbi:MAG: Na/Pi symporter [bacterium]|nr:Na/Pi symporter [bacterium]MBU1918992.1 Na/Pi symporter [bacterium]